MNIQWVLADNLVLDPTADVMRMKRGGAFWGSWKTWREDQASRAFYFQDCYKQ